MFLFNMHIIGENSYHADSLKSNTDVLSDHYAVSHITLSSWL